MLHKRDKSIYGEFSLEKAEKDCEAVARELGLRFDGIIINAAAYTHTSVAIRDALEIFNKPKIELHISNIFKREEFRHHSYMSEVVDGVICGLGISGYPVALLAINNLIKK